MMIIPEGHRTLWIRCLHLIVKSLNTTNKLKRNGRVVKNKLHTRVYYYQGVKHSYWLNWNRLHRHTIIIKRWILVSFWGKYHKMGQKKLFLLVYFFFLSLWEVCNKRKTTVATCGAGPTYTSGSLCFQRGSWCYSIFIFLCSVLQIVLCHFVLFCSVIVLFVLRQYTPSINPFVSFLNNCLIVL